MDSSTSLNCPHCRSQLFQMSADGTKLRARTSMLILHKSGDAVEINCGHCKHGVLIPLKHSDGPFELKKAAAPRLVARRS